MSDQKKKNRGIYNGNEFWGKAITDGLVKIAIENRQYYRYQSEPDSLYESLKRTESFYPERICIVDDDGTSYTYREFLNMVDYFSKILYHRYHVCQSDQVGILLYNSLEFCVSVYAVNKLKAVAVPYSTKYRESEVKSLMKKSDIKGVLYHKDFEGWMKGLHGNKFLVCMNKELLCGQEQMEAIPERKAKPEENAILMFTSGTTSQSKGVMLKNFHVMHGIEVYKRIFGICMEDVTILSVPAYHVTGLLAILGLFLYAGGCVRLHKFFDAETVLRETKEKHITYIHGSPTVYSMLLEKRHLYPELPTVRLMACGSGNMPRRKLKEIGSWMPQAEFRTVYGLTETASPATIFPENAVGSIHIGSSGVPIPGTEFKICDEGGELLPSGEVGNIFVRGTNVIEKYYDRTDQAGSGQWLDTGDIGYFDEDGYLYITDRKKDMINRGGEKICSYDVENLLYELPGIKEAAVIGIPDERYGEVPAAMIAGNVKECPKEEEIRKILKQKLAKFQIPVKFVFRESLPLTANLKIDKREIRRILAEEKEE